MIQNCTKGLSGVNVRLQLTLDTSQQSLS